MRGLVGERARAGDGERRRHGVERIGDGAAGAEIARRIGRLRGDGLRPLRRQQSDLFAPGAVGGRRHGAEQRRAVIDRHGQAGVGCIDGARDRLRGLVGERAGAGDGQNWTDRGWIRPARPLFPCRSGISEGLAGRAGPENIELPEVRGVAAVDLRAGRIEFVIE